MNDMVKPVGLQPAEMVEEYIVLRDRMAEAKDKFEQWCEANGSVRMKLLEAAMLDMLNGLGIDSIKAPSGTVYKKISTSVTVADAAEFRRHVIGAEAWDLLDWRVNKTTVNDLVDQGEQLPPGINRTAFQTVGVRRK